MTVGQSNSKKGRRGGGPKMVHCIGRSRRWREACHSRAQISWENWLNTYIGWGWIRRLENPASATALALTTV